MRGTVGRRNNMDPALDENTKKSRVFKATYFIDDKHIPAKPHTTVERNRFLDHKRLPGVGGASDDNGTHWTGQECLEFVGTLHLSVVHDSTLLVVRADEFALLTRGGWGFKVICLFRVPRAHLKPFLLLQGAKPACLGSCRAHVTCAAPALAKYFIK